MTSILDHAKNALEVAQWASSVAGVFFQKGLASGMNYCNSHLETVTDQQLLAVTIAVCLIGTVVSLKFLGTAKKEIQTVKEVEVSSDAMEETIDDIDLTPTYYSNDEEEDDDEDSDNESARDDESTDEFRDSIIDQEEERISPVVVSPPKKKKKETLAQMRKRVAKEMKEAEERRRRQQTRAAGSKTTASAGVQKETRAQMRARVAKEFAAKKK